MAWKKGELSLINFTEDMRPKGRVNNDMERALVQGDLIFCSWGQANMHFNKVIDKLLQLRAKSGGYTYLT